MKVCVVSAVAPRHMTIATIYFEFLKNHDISCDVIYFDKYNDGLDTLEYGNPVAFKQEILRNENKFKKIFKYFKFKKFAINKIMKGNYDFVIVWGEIPIYLIGIFLSLKFKKKYCLNIRDYFFQKQFFHVRYIFKKTISNSLFTTISSDGFLTFLPKHDYIRIHSVNLPLLKNNAKRINKVDLLSSRIKITFIGLVRFFDADKKILGVFGNDERFQINYFGTNSKILQKFCFENGINNVKFIDSFPISETSSLLNEADLINNLYGNDSIDLKQAISIKFYHGVYCRIPILVNKDTYGEKIVRKYNIGFVFEKIDEENKERLYNWYRKFDFDEFDKGCELFIEQAFNDNLKFDKILEQTFLNESGWDI